MRDYSDYIGKTFGKLTVTGYEKRNGCAYFKCKCSCGNPEYKFVRKDHLLNHDIESCGCKYHERSHSRVPFPTYKRKGGIVTGTTFDGQTFLFDESDFDIVRPYCWYFDRYGYVVARKDKKAVKLHRMLLDFPEQKVDHINRNRSDNRKCNLRIVTDQQNAINRSKSKSFSTPMTGVRKHPSNGKWEVRLSYNGQPIPYTVFDTYEEAAKARLEAEQKYFGEYAPQKTCFNV